MCALATFFFSAKLIAMRSHHELTTKSPVEKQEMGACPSRWKTARKGPVEMEWRREERYWGEPRPGSEPGRHEMCGGGRRWLNQETFENAWATVRPGLLQNGCQRVQAGGAQPSGRCLTFS